MSKHQELRTKPIPLALVSNITRDCGSSGFVVYSALLCYDEGQGVAGIKLDDLCLAISTRTAIRALSNLTSYRFARVIKGRPNKYHLAWVQIHKYKWPQSFMEFVCTKHAGHKSMPEYLASPYWRNIRQQALERDNNQCVVCGRGANLHVHHLHYENKGHEKLEDLITLCPVHHGMQTACKTSRDD